MRILRKLNYWWYRGGVTPRLIVFAIGAISIAALIFTQFPREQVDNAPSSVMFFLLVNLNIVLLGAFAVLIGRNVFKLLVDRRNKILGARLRTRLVLAFVGLSLVPTAILFAFASGFITDSVDDWFNSPVEVSVEGAVEVSRSHHVWLEQYVLRTGKMLARQVESKPDLFIDDKVLESFLAQQAREFQLDRVSVLAADQKLLFSSPKNQSGKGSVEELGIDPGTVKTSMRKGAVVLPGELGKEHLVTSYVPLNALGRDLTLVASVRVSPDLVYTLNSVVDAFNEYKQLKTFRQPLKSGYLLTLTMITCLILFSAIWLGFYIARELSGPIQRLAEGTREVARGNYDFRLKVFGDDEISSLVRSFNRMTLDLKSSRKESEERRIYLESMLANMGVGVIAVDGARQITLVNSVARDLFKLNSSMKVVGLSLIHI